MSRVCAIAVHPDDETLGCGGTLLKHAAAGDDIHWIIVTTTRGVAGFPESFASKRDAEIERVADAYGFASVEKLELPTTQLDAIDFSTVVSKLAGAVKGLEPHVVYLPFSRDVHTDHQVVAKAGLAMVKTFRYPFVRRVAMMETLSETEYLGFEQAGAFCPNFFVDTSEHHAQKKTILALYESEVGEHPHPRSLHAVDALATLRGSMCGAERAESFQLVRDVW